MQGHTPLLLLGAGSGVLGHAVILILRSFEGCGDRRA